MNVHPPSHACATKLGVLADPTRLGVLTVLLGGPRHVNEINQDLQVPQNLLSHHLRVLREAGLVAARRDGRAVRYALASGVEIGRSGDVIDLGCCRLTFRPRRRARGRHA